MIMKIDCIFWIWLSLFDNFIIWVNRSSQVKGIPGYTGHAAKLYPENVYGLTYQEGRARTKLLQLDKIENDIHRLEKRVNHE